MAILDFLSGDDGLVLHGSGVRLRPPRMSDFAEWAAVREVSRTFLQPWEPVWPEDDLTRPAFRRRITSYQRDMELGHGYPFFVYREEDGALVGGVTLSNLRRGVAQAATLGYWCGLPYVRKGHTLTAVKAVCAFAFDQLQLHRVEAACIPDNGPSRDLLLKAGFSLEGKARAYLKINGVWRDHLLFGLVRDEAVSA